ncbi:MAG: beta-eliminating lyase-related protein [Gammaproteobacteria bacterium]|nr:beta-eliminating lyase-related protein [Gammaproteobacteria bacterium]
MLRNTVSGCVQPQADIDRLVECAQQHGLATHMDGARLLNSATAQNPSPARMVQAIDSVSLCLSKGLGVPLGSMLVGEVAFIKQARRWRKMLGGGMRQAGVIAAAGRYALRHNVARLADDHRRTKRLASALEGVGDLTFDMSLVQTNMLFLQSAQMSAMAAYLGQQGIAISASGDTTRMVIHLDIDDVALQQIIDAITDFFSQK